MILVAGTPCSGKTTLINSNSGWRNSLNANSIREKLPDKPFGLSTVIHYDNLRPFKRNLNRYSSSDDTFLQLLEKQSNIQIITVLAPLRTQLTRLQERKKRLIKKSTPQSRLDKIDRVIGLYQNPSLFMKIFDQWLTYCQNLQTVSHHINFNTNQSTYTQPINTLSSKELEKFVRTEMF